MVLSTKILLGLFSDLFPPFPEFWEGGLKGDR
jgi:hypothetical protein